VAPKPKGVLLTLWTLGDGQPTAADTLGFRPKHVSQDMVCKLNVIVNAGCLHCYCSWTRYQTCFRIYQCQSVLAYVRTSCLTGIWTVTTFVMTSYGQVASRRLPTKSLSADILMQCASICFKSFPAVLISTSSPLLLTLLFIPEHLLPLNRQQTKMQTQLHLLPSNPNLQRPLFQGTTWKIG